VRSFAHMSLGISDRNNTKIGLSLEAILNICNNCLSFPPNQMRKVGETDVKYFAASVQVVYDSKFNVEIINSMPMSYYLK